MTYKGVVHNGVIVLPHGADLAEGTEVIISVDQQQAPKDILLGEILKLAKPRDWPPDYATNHGHYVKGHPKQT